MNKNVLRADLNESIVFKFLISSGREFHRCGAAYENDLCPQVYCSSWDISTVSENRQRSAVSENVYITYVDPIWVTILNFLCPFPVNFFNEFYKYCTVYSLLIQLKWRRRPQDGPATMCVKTLNIIQMKVRLLVLLTNREQAHVHLQKLLQKVSFAR